MKRTHATMSNHHHISNTQQDPNPQFADPNNDPNPNPQSHLRRPRGFAATNSITTAAAAGTGTTTNKSRKEREKEKERTKLRERHRRAITSRMLAGLRQYGNYQLPVRADMNDVLAALARQAGWIVEPDGTTFRQSPNNTTNNMVSSHFLSNTLFFDKIIHSHFGISRVLTNFMPFKLEFKFCASSVYKIFHIIK